MCDVIFVILDDRSTDTHICTEKTVCAVCVCVCAMNGENDDGSDRNIERLFVCFEIENCDDPAG